MSVPEHDLVRQVMAAVAAGDAAGARLALHPYLHWTEDGRTTRGRSRVLALLADRAALSEPAEVELRDGQIYRWLADD